MHEHATTSRWNDPQYGAAFYIFSSFPDPSVCEFCWRHVDSGGIETQKLLEATAPWSHGERLLVKAAVDLFQPGGVQRFGHRPANLGEIANTLDDEQLQVVLNALKVVRGEVRALDLVPEMARALD